MWLFEINIKWRTFTEISHMPMGMVCAIKWMFKANALVCNGVCQSGNYC